MLDTDLQIIIDTLKHEIKSLYDGFFMQQKKIDLLEKIYGRVMQQDMRIDTLEFNSNLPVKPGISEALADLRFRVEQLENLNHKELDKE